MAARIDQHHAVHVVIAHGRKRACRHRCAQTKTAAREGGRIVRLVCAYTPGGVVDGAVEVSGVVVVGAGVGAGAGVVSAGADVLCAGAGAVVTVSGCVVTVAGAGAAGAAVTGAAGRAPV